MSKHLHSTFRASLLDKQSNRLLQIIRRIIKPQPPIQSRNPLHLPRTQLKLRDIQILEQPIRVVGFGDHGETALGGPSQEDLGGGLFVGCCGGFDGCGVE